MSTAKATDPMGFKRICTDCGIRFYDFNKRPIKCPSCETEFTGEVKVKSRRGRLNAIEKKEEAPVKEAVSKEEEITQEDDDGVEVVSLDDVDEKSSDKDDDAAAKLGDGEENLDGIPDLDEDLDDSPDDDVTLLDEDED